MKKKFDASIPRKMFWSFEIEDKNTCPECHEKLENEYHAYMIAIKEDKDFETLITGNESGYFCPECPTVVLDRNRVNQFISASIGFDRQAEFAVLGIVDLNAVPEDKKNIPFSDIDNPVPLVKFTNTSFNFGRKSSKVKLKLVKKNRKKKSKKRK